MNEQAQLPDGWRWVQIDDVCVSNTGTRNPELEPTKTFTYVDISSVDNVLKRIVDAKEILGRGAPSRARQVIYQGDVLVSGTRPNLNAVALVQPELHDQICSTGFCVLRPKPELDPKFLYAFVQTADFVQTLSLMVQGAMYPAVTSNQVRSIYIPLPPLPEQRRIATVIADHLAQVEAARVAAQAELETAETLLSSYLREVFESEAAQSWKIEALRDVGNITSGITLGPARRNKNGRVVPYLRVANVKDGYLDLSDVYEIEATPAEIEKCRLKSGDLLLTEGGDPDKLGRGTYWQEQLPECLHQNHIFRVRFDLDLFYPPFVSLQMNSSYGKAYFLAHAKQTTGIATINHKVLGDFPLLAPSIEVQCRVANEVNGQVEHINALVEAMQKQLNYINLTPDLILRQTFSGEL